MNEMKIGTSTFYSLLSRNIIDAVNELENAGISTIELMYEYPHIFFQKRKLGF